jgi:hypothetical protein
VNHYLEAEAIDARCENWAECYRDRHRRQQVASLEGAYRSPQREHWLHGLAPPVERPDLDWRDAELINGAWQAIPTAYHQIILGAWYVRRWSPAKCERVACADMPERPRRGITDTEWQVVLDSAHAHLLEQLDLPAVTRRERLAERVRGVLDLIEWRRLEALPLDSRI